jgi:hypothetical protein
MSLTGLLLKSGGRGMGNNDAAAPFNQLDISFNIDNGKMGNSSGQVALSSREYLLKGRISTVDFLVY